MKSNSGLAITRLMPVRPLCTVMTGLCQWKRYGVVTLCTDIRNLSEGREAMQLKISHILVNTTEDGVDKEYTYEMDRPDWELNRRVMDVAQHHPSLTSIVVTLVRNKP